MWRKRARTNPAVNNDQNRFYGFIYERSIDIFQFLNVQEMNLWKQ